MQDSFKEVKYRRTLFLNQLFKRTKCFSETLVLLQNVKIYRI